MLENIEFNSLLSALIGGFFALFGVLVNSRLSKKNTEKEDKNKVENFIDSIHLELNTLWDLYYSSIGSKVEEYKDDEPFMHIYHAKQDYFIVYKNNSNYIGSIECKELRESIVRTYILCKSILDTYELNNEFIDLYTKYNDNGDIKKRDMVRSSLVESTASIKDIHSALKEKLNNLNKVYAEYKKNNQL